MNEFSLTIFFPCVCDGNHYNTFMSFFFVCEIIHNFIHLKVNENLVIFAFFLDTQFLIAFANNGGHWFL